MRRIPLPPAVVQKLRGLARRAAGVDRGRIWQLLDGYRTTAVIVTAAEIGLIDHLADRRASADELAEALSCDRSALERFLRALAALGVVTVDGRRFGLTRSGRAFANSDARGMAALVAEEFVPAWSALRSSVADGLPSFHRVFGKTVWEHRRTHPHLNNAFNGFMARVQARTVDGIVSAFDFSGADVVVDVGGGSGRVLAQLLRRYPNARGVLFDQEHVVASARETFDRAAVAARCEFVGGSFLDSVPAGADVYLLQRILHDWDDESARQILRNCREAMRPDGAVLVVENVMPAGLDVPVAVALRDIHMLAVLGGRERTEAEYRELLASAGMRLAACTHTRFETDVIEARQG